MGLKVDHLLIPKWPKTKKLVGKKWNKCIFKFFTKKSKFFFQNGPYAINFLMPWGGEVGRGHSFDFTRPPLMFNSSYFDLYFLNLAYYLMSMTSFDLGAMDQSFWPPFTDLKNWKFQIQLNIGMLHINGKLKTAALQRKYVLASLRSNNWPQADLNWPLMTSKLSVLEYVHDA